MSRKSDVTPSLSQVVSLGFKPPCSHLQALGWERVPGAVGAPAASPQAACPQQALGSGGLGSGPEGAEEAVCARHGPRPGPVGGPGVAHQASCQGWGRSRPHGQRESSGLTLRGRRLSRHRNGSCRLWSQLRAGRGMSLAWVPSGATLRVHEQMCVQLWRLSTPPPHQRGHSTVTLLQACPCGTHTPGAPVHFRAWGLPRSKTTSRRSRTRRR